MAVFSDYARYYDLLYRDKDYAKETAFVLDAFARLGSRPQTVLDLGCGTGKHAMQMADRGILVAGVDVSETMVHMGTEAIRALDADAFGGTAPSLLLGDARTVRLDRTFDAVTSLFHVMSYQNSEEDALAVMKTAWEHLKPGGLFLFDFWHGPGVLTDPPTRRELMREDEHCRVHRLAEPEHHLGDDVVLVKYTITLTRKENDAVTPITESHSMRYWFLPELRYLARQVGFSVQRTAGWMHTDFPDVQDWNAFMILRR